MPRALPHLDLPSVQAPVARKKNGGGGNTKRSDPGRHALRLDQEVAIVRQQAQRPRAPGAKPALIFKLSLDPKRDFDEDMLGRYGLTLVARDENKLLVVFASDGDLAVFRDRVSTYGSPVGRKYGEVGNIEGVAPITASDRTGRRLAREPFLPIEVGVPVDVELWHPGTSSGARERLAELKAIVEANSPAGRISDDFVGADTVVARCHVDATLLESLLDTDIVREVDRVPTAVVDRVQTIGTDPGQLPNITPVRDGAAGVLVIDSGVMANHPLLAPAMGDAQVFPDELGQRDGVGAADGDVYGGHGTAVAGFAAWGKPHKVVDATAPAAEVALFSARVCDANGEYDPELLVEHQLEEAVRYFLDNYPECRVVNISLGDSRLVFVPGQRQTRLAARIDELAYQLRDRGVLFVISSGNFEHVPQTPADHRSHVDEYPRYLTGDDAKLIEPATAALALTVGGLSAGGQAATRAYQAGRRSVAGTAGFPSPFTRSGPGVGSMIKPEFVEDAGDFVYDPSAPQPLATRDIGVGLPTTNRDFAPPGGRLLRAVSGTSFAAPAVAHAAARLFNEFPDASPNLIRALLADSGELPADRPDLFDGSHDDDVVLNTYGYGRPSFQRAAFSADNHVLLKAEGTIDLDSFQLFEIPFLPADFLARGERTITVSLAFDPPTRQTRGDSYLGLAMDFHLFRNVSRDVVVGAFRDWKEAPAVGGELVLDRGLSEIPARQKIEFLPGPTVRKRGTLQRGVHRTTTLGWEYDGEPVILAISCLRRWAPPEVTSQRFAVVVSLRHSDPDAQIHAPLRTRLRPRVRGRAR